MFKNKLNFKIKAFTLIELLVVVAIIAILTSIVVVGLQSVRQKANDTKRLSDLKELEISIQAYRNVYNKYPDAGVQSSDNYIIGLTPTFISKLPKDPSGVQNAVSGFKYWVSVDKKTACVEVIGTVYNMESQKDLIYYKNGVKLEKSWIRCTNGYTGPID